MNKLLYLRDVATVRLDETKCTRCGMCLIVCPHAVLQRSNGSIVISEADACMECGACATNCPTGAITVKAGVGCAAAVINSALGRKGSACCCVVEDNQGHPASGKQSSCC